MVRSKKVDIPTLNLFSYKNYIKILMKQLQCCGVSNYTDWMRLSPQRVIPIACCVDKTHCVTANYSDVYQRVSEYGIIKLGLWEILKQRTF